MIRYVVVYCAMLIWIYLTKGSQWIAWWPWGLVIYMIYIITYYKICRKIDSRLIQLYLQWEVVIFFPCLAAGQKQFGTIHDKITRMFLYSYFQLTIIYHILFIENINILYKHSTFPYSIHEFQTLKSNLNIIFQPSKSYYFQQYNILFHMTLDCDFIPFLFLFMLHVVSNFIKII